MERCTQNPAVLHGIRSHHLTAYNSIGCFFKQISTQTLNGSAPLQDRGHRHASSIEPTTKTNGHPLNYGAIKVVFIYFVFLQHERSPCGVTAHPFVCALCLWLHKYPRACLYLALATGALCLGGGGGGLGENSGMAYTKKS
ncbi:hypothetical protein FVEG_16667 [Fusarium verticillioides 7600]|uniref:Uncharacterized protein n=1 Tax=Gibberella moniliformis (strain M3125 / FGSC 7600) TaxID=334819 RepID=W7MG31_GIBM7|nr:hypothetical protein FVEG_16667 [Fusarium verticillioides 7600]EWG50638.1 hypothetical protein FVEG_16667 [Fusarium verticillioides 7600]